MNEFKERYKLFDNRKLLKIIEEAENYQPIAIEAAKMELLKRNISHEDIQSVKDEIFEKEAKIKEKQEKVKKIESKAKEIGAELFKTISPIQNEHQIIERKVNLIVIVFALLAIYQIFDEFGMIKFMFVENLSDWNFSIIFYFLPLILLPIGVFLFWKRRKLGWILMTAYFVKNIVNAIRILLLSWEWNKGKYINDNSIGDFKIEIKEIESVFRRPNPIALVMVVVFFGSILWGVTKPDLRREFHIDKKNAFVIICLAALITILILGIA